MRTIALIYWFLIGAFLLFCFFYAFVPNSIETMWHSVKAIWNDHPIGVFVSTVIFLALCHLMEVDERWKYRMSPPMYNLLVIAAYTYQGAYILMFFYVANGHY
jgi:hypothetical protein